MTLSRDQILAVKQGEPVRVTAPEIGGECVVLRADVYDRVRTRFDDELSANQVGVVVSQNMREYDADDPLLDSYQQYRR
jgi:hypothetical protein